ncbi:helix-turn-helix domain-containing protein [Faecalicoccus acidiformans]|uniref:helix-turn-helix domain-containing protein n=1 Tax=Faecalicoccus acidiformans TaxID=915173 RepID=UPI0023544717|nr:helix-turn-helix transcriptional regulator [Faecalicoccus acidiformans]
MELTFGERLKDVMEEKGITQKELCKLTGISTTTLSNAMNDISRSEYDKEQGVVMKCNNLIKLCNVLNVSADYLLGLSNVQDIGNSEKNDISKITGLTGKSIEKLMRYKNDKFPNRELEALNLLLENDDLVLYSLYEYLSIYPFGETYGQMNNEDLNRCMSDYDKEKILLFELMERIDIFKSHLKHEYDEQYRKKKINDLEIRIATEDLTEEETEKLSKLIKKLKNYDKYSLI